MPHYVSRGLGFFQSPTSQAAKANPSSSKSALSYSVIMTQVSDFRQGKIISPVSK